MDFLAPSNNTWPNVRVLIFGHKDFSHLMSRASEEFQRQAEFKIHDAIIGSASEVQPYIQKFEPHVVVSAGANAAYLKSVLDIPVVTLCITDDDWVDALARASKVANDIDVICFDQTSRVLSLLAKEFGVSVNQHVYHTSDQAREKFHALRKSNASVVVGASLVCGLANQFDLASVLVYSQASCKRTIHEAIEVGRSYAKQSEANTLTHWLLTKSKTPIILTDRNGEQCRVNKAAKQELGLKNDDDFNIYSLIKTDPKTWVQYDGECQIDGKEWWYHCDQVTLLGSQRYVFQLYRKHPAKASLKTQTLSNAQSSDSQVVCESPQMQEVMAQVAAFATSPGNVLIYGESGTGKELIAQKLHANGPYHQGQFVAVNCGAIPADLFEGELFGYHEGAYTGSRRGGRKGLIETARNGALFLDEISELQPLQQTKLLRFIQERRFRPLGANEEVEIDLKLIAASNRPLDEMVAESCFREDLYYRLNVFKINVPALRYRAADIRAIAKSKLETLLNRYQVQADTDEVCSLIEQYAKQYPWPGNIRELENVTERVVAWLKTSGNSKRLADIILHIVPEFKQIQLSNESAGSLQTQESQLIVQAMQQWNGDRRKVAEHLGISPTTLWRRLKKLNYKE